MALVAAKVLIHGEIDLAHYRGAELTDPATFELSKRVLMVADGKSVSRAAPINWFLASLASIKGFDRSVFTGGSKELGDAVTKVDDYSVTIKQSAENAWFLTVLTVYSMAPFDSAEMRKHATAENPWSISTPTQSASRASGGMPGALGQGRRVRAARQPGLLPRQVGDRPRGDQARAAERQPGPDGAKRAGALRFFEAACANCSAFRRSGRSSANGPSGRTGSRRRIERSHPRLLSGRLRTAAGLGRKSALIIIDFCMAYLEPASPLYAAAEPARDATIRLLGLARAAGIPVLHTQVRYAEGGADGGVSFRKVGALRLFEGDTALGRPPDALKPLPGEVVITKRYARAFSAPRSPPR